MIVRLHQGYHEMVSGFNYGIGGTSTTTGFVSRLVSHLSSFIFDYTIHNASGTPRTRTGRHHSLRGMAGVDGSFSTALLKRSLNLDLQKPSGYPINAVR